MREYPTRIKPTPTILWSSGVLKILDQTKLPEVEEYIHTKDYMDVIAAIKRLSIRGAPALGCAGAYACALSAYKCNSLLKESFKQVVFNDWDKIANARPTAVNLKWAVEIIKKQLEDYLDNTDWDLIETRQFILDCAKQIHEDDIKRCDSLCVFGSNLIPNDSRIMTICNTGGLCSGGIGTALGCIQYAHAGLRAKKVEVYVLETRPLLQGARLNTWELERSNIPYKLITDSMAGAVMRDKKIDLVIVGADRIAKNGDTANKIGTYNLAVLAKHHNIPFYVAAPYSTVDHTIQSGKNIPIEERTTNEISSYTSKVYNPAFDVTPFELINTIITDKGYWK